MTSKKTPTVQSVYSYDQVPYRSLPFAQSHPDRLAVIATLFGMMPQPIDRCRVLELGCASGGNLIPMAEMFTESLFLGVDLSERQLAEGWDIVRRLRLENIRLLRCDIRDVGPETGTFHYIIAHGVYSWVPIEVQRKILQICRDQLEPNGVAYISYNTYPGWRMRGMIRDMLVYHTQHFSEPQQRIDQSRELLRFLAESADKDSAYGAYLKEELNLFSQASDSYLYHDHLEDDNEPIYFHDFVSQAEHVGLQFLGEADFHMMAYWNFAPEISQTLERLSGDLIQIEQYMDFLRNRAFRQTLLCQRHHSLERALDGSQLERLYIASPLQVQSEDDASDDEQSLRLRHGKVTVTTRNPLIKAAHLLLADAWPQWMGFEELLEKAYAQCTDVSRKRTPAGSPEEAALREHLIRCYAAQAVELHTLSSPFAIRVSQQPRVSPLVRLQAETGRVVTNRKHEAVSLDVVGRQIVRCLDGQHDRLGIERFVRDRFEQGELVVQDEAEENLESRQAQALITEICERTLAQLRDLALLIG